MKVKVVLACGVLIAGIGFAQSTSPSTPATTDAARYELLKKTARKLQAADVISWQEKAAAGDPEAQWMLGLAYDEGNGVAADRDKASQWYKQSAAQGYPPAENALGVAFATGSGVPRDPAEAVRWFRLAAEHGFPNGQANLATAYSDGLGVRRDDRLAVEWARKAAEQQNVSGQNLLGWAYAEGKGVRRDMAEALRWFRLAAEQGAPGAAYNLGIAYRDGKGVEKDRNEAIRWFSRAAEAGWVNAAYEIAGLYIWRGWLDHKHDYVNAYAWCLIGQELQRRAAPEDRLQPDKVPHAEKLTSIIAKEMGMADITAAQTIATEWIRAQTAAASGDEKGTESMPARSPDGTSLTGASAALPQAPSAPVQQAIRLVFVGEATGEYWSLLGNDGRLYVQTSKGWRNPHVILRVVDLHRGADLAYRAFDCVGIFSMLLTADASELVVQDCYQLFILDPVTLGTKIELKQPVPEKMKTFNQTLAVAPDRKRMALETIFTGKNTSQHTITVFRTADWQVEPTAEVIDETWMKKRWSGILGRFVGADRSSDGIWSCSPAFEESSAAVLDENSPSFLIMRDGRVVAKGEPWRMSEEEKRNAKKEPRFPVTARIYGQCQMSRDGKYVMVAFSFGNGAERFRVYKIESD